MEYGQIAGNHSINNHIYFCFKYLPKQEQYKFVKKFREQPHKSDQLLHTYRELIVGAFLAFHGLKAKYDYTIDKQTPDWCLFNEQSEITGIVEVTNFHIDKETNDYIEHNSQNGKIVYYWQDQNKNNASIYDERPNRLYNHLREKAVCYNSLIDKNNYPYIIALFTNFVLSIDFEEEVCPLLENNESGLFREYKGISGVLHFWDNNGRYYFRYAQNHNALRMLSMPEGVFPPY